VEFFRHLRQSFRGEMGLGVLADHLIDPSPFDRTIQNCCEQVDAVLERQYYTHFVITSRLKACGHPGINPVFHIDWLWHAHVISPAKHHRACVDAFGEIIDHTPGPILEDSRPIWRSLFGETPADEIIRTVRLFRGTRQVEVVSAGGDSLATLELEGCEPIHAIKTMIDNAGGPPAGRQRLMLSDGTLLDDGNIASDIPQGDLITACVGRLHVEVTGDVSTTLELEAGADLTDIQKMIQAAGGPDVGYQTLTFDDGKRLPFRMMRGCNGDVDLSSVLLGRGIKVEYYDPSCG